MKKKLGVTFSHKYSYWSGMRGPDRFFFLIQIRHVKKRGAYYFNCFLLAECAPEFLWLSHGNLYVFLYLWRRHYAPGIFVMIWNILIGKLFEKNVVRYVLIVKIGVATINLLNRRPVTYNNTGYCGRLQNLILNKSLLFMKFTYIQEFSFDNLLRIP